MGYDVFRADSALENKGVWMDYAQGFRVLLARAGGTNSRYAKVAEAKLKPVRRALKAGLMSTKAGDKVLLEIFAASVILDWEIEVVEKGKTVWKKGIEDPETGEVLKPSPESYIKVLSHPELMDLWTAIQGDATDLAIFLKDIRAVEAKNS